MSFFLHKLSGLAFIKQASLNALTILLLLVQGCSVLQTRDLPLAVDAEFIRLHDIAADHAVSAETNFAVQLNRYRQDDDYHCKRPVFAAYFQKRYGRSESVSECNALLPFRLSSGIEGSRIKWLNPERVKEIHLLLAGQGEHIMSRFGHLSFRLIICPEDYASDDACDSNLYEHLVLGYRAHIDDFNISFVSGVFGGYRAHLYAHQFMDVYQEYAIGEFRELYSLPMKLSRTEINQLLRAMSDVHWNYAGDYRFLTNNCSSIAQKFLLHNWEGFSEDPLFSSIYWRPDRFFESIRQSHFAAGAKLKNLTVAENEGYYFPSTQPIYERAFDLVARSRVNPEFDTLEQYSHSHPLKRRSDALADNNYIRLLRHDAQVFEAHMLLEELALIRYERHLMSELVETVDEIGIETLKNTLNKQLFASEFQSFQRCILQPLELHIQPTSLSDGIPDQARLEIFGSAHTSNLACSSETEKNHIKTVFEHLKQRNIAGWQKVDKAIHFWVSALDNLNFYNNLAQPTAN